MAAPPFVSYSTLTEAVVPADEWSFLYASLQAQKAHVQEYPGCQRFEVWIDPEDGSRHYVPERFPSERKME